jgi:hypothetical protein
MQKNETEHLRSQVEDLKAEVLRLQRENQTLPSPISQTAAQSALPQSELKFRLAFHTSPDAINLNRLSDGMYVDVNEGFTH